jgi:nucleotide-binding universal stress UspA family protein
MYKRILVAVDGSETSNRALQEAITLAKETHATLRLCHVIDLTVIYSDLDASLSFEFQGVLEAAGRKVVEKASAAARGAGVEFDSKTMVIDRPGQHIYDAIEDEVKGWPADLIVVGTHGRRGIRRLFLGSVAEGITRVASKPVLLIRGE